MQPGAASAVHSVGFLGKHPGLFCNVRVEEPLRCAGLPGYFSDHRVRRLKADHPGTRRDSDMGTTIQGAHGQASLVYRYQLEHAVLTGKPAYGNQPELPGFDRWCWHPTIVTHATGVETLAHIAAGFMSGAPVWSCPCAYARAKSCKDVFAI